MSEIIEYFEVIGPGMDVIKRFRDRENAEDFANQERTRRMKSLDEEDNLTAGERRGEKTYRTWGIIVKHRELLFSDHNYSSDPALEFWNNANTRNYPPGF